MKILTYSSDRDFAKSGINLTFHNTRLKGKNIQNLGKKSQKQN